MFEERILPFDTRSAEMYPAVVMRARQRGNPIAVADAQVAAIAASQAFSVATRDTMPFHAAGIPVINPWERGP